MAETYPVLPLKNTVVYPQIVIPLAVGRPKSLAAVNAGIESGRRIVTVAQKQASIEDPARDDLFPIGTIATINRVEKREKGAQVIVQGVERIRLGTAIDGSSHLEVEYERLPSLSMEELGDDAANVDALLRENLELSKRIASLYGGGDGDQIYQQLIGSINDPVTQMYRIANLANITLEQEQAVLECESTRDLMEQVHEILLHEVQVSELRRQIAEQARDDIDQQQREHLLRQQKRAIEQALGESGEDEDVAELRKQLEEAQLPAHAKTEVDRELKRLGRMSPNAADYQVARGYLELIAELPWHQQTEDQLDLEHARVVLDEDHYGLDDVKERILESLAVMQLNPQANAPILCFVGPPGVGKTSLGQSIARAMGRKFERMSLGGLHDESELRGHRRTYIGAMPGRILQGRAPGRRHKSHPDARRDRQARPRLPGRPRRRPDGDPGPGTEQGVPRQLPEPGLRPLEGAVHHHRQHSGSIPRPLLDRMEVLELSGYSDMEKQAIARQYLIPRRRTEAGLAEEQLEISDEGLRYMIRRHTREAGVRELERVIGRIARKRAGRWWKSRPMRTRSPWKHSANCSGPRSSSRTTARTNMAPGVAAGLAWTEAGGGCALRRGDPHPERRESDADGASRPGHAGVGQARAQLYLVDRRSHRPRPGGASRSAACTFMYPPGPCPRTGRPRA